MDVHQKERLPESEWRLAFVIPNLVLRQSFEFGDIAIVSGGDPRLDPIEKSNPAARVLLHGFVNHLPPKQRPSVVIYRYQSKFRNLWEAMIDARNAVAVASACYGWIQSIGRQQSFVIRYTDHFDAYQRFPSDNGNHLSYRGPAGNIVSSNLEGFKGETHPYLMVTSIANVACDDELLTALQSAWRKVHVTGRTSTQHRRLFRSLSIAYEACRVPQAMDNALYDHGKHCSLWVSAFETLAHPGTHVGLDQVLELIAKRYLHDAKIRRKVTMKHGKKALSLNTAQRLYLRLYHARNDFLHGNRFSVRKFVPRCLAKGIRLLDTAPLLFHTALEGFMQPVASRPPGNGVERIMQILRYNALEESFERALR